MPFVNSVYACHYGLGGERSAVASAHSTGRSTPLSGHSQGCSGERPHRLFFAGLRDQPLPGDSSLYWGV